MQSSGTPAALVFSLGPVMALDLWCASLRGHNQAKDCTSNPAQSPAFCLPAEKFPLKGTGGL